LIALRAGCVPVGAAITEKVATAKSLKKPNAKSRNFIKLEFSDKFLDDR
jgi:hypothetical protein